MHITTDDITSSLYQDLLNTKDNSVIKLNLECVLSWSDLVWLS